MSNEEEILVASYPNCKVGGEMHCGRRVSSLWDTVCLALSLVFFFCDFIDDDENILISSPFTVFLCLSLPILSTFLFLCDVLYGLNWCPTPTNWPMLCVFVLSFGFLYLLKSP